MEHLNGTLAKGLPGDKQSASLIEEKKFYKIFPPGANVVKLFTAVINEFS